MRQRVTVHGRVQGVFFRNATRERARSRGVSGWVANRDDGSVEAVFEGDAEAVANLVEFCRRGPRGAEVTALDVEQEPPEGLQGFCIRR